MRGGAEGPDAPVGTDHIWLRQSVTFAVNGQTRTLEMALPLRPGATPDEVEALLDEADAGMRRLSRRLDAHLAEVIGAPTPAPTPAPTSGPITAAQPAPTSHEAAGATPSTAGERRPAGRVNETPARTTKPPAPAPSASSPAPAARPAPRPSTPPTPPAPAVTGGPDLSIAEFISAAQALGLDPREAMRRLGVRSLNGLNLRESLDLLRRQLLRDGGHGDVGPDDSADLQGAGEEMAESAAARAPSVTPMDGMPAPIGRPRFDEEDDDSDFQLTYAEPGDLPDEYGDYALDDEDLDDATVYPAATPVAPVAPVASVSGPLSDVPGLDELLRRHALAGAAAPPATPVPPAEAAPAHAVAPDVAAEDPQRVRAREIIAALRAAQPGGTASQQQRTAFRNIVVDQLSETKASGLSRAVWNVTPDRLGPEQLDAFNSWGKQDDFAEEAEVALTILREEYIARNRAQGKEGAAASSAPAAPAAPTGAPTSASGPRSRSASSRAPGGASRSESGGSQGGA